MHACMHATPTTYLPTYLLSLPTECLSFHKIWNEKPDLYSISFDASILSAGLLPKTYEYVRQRLSSTIILTLAVTYENRNATGSSMHAARS